MTQQIVMAVPKEVAQLFREGKLPLQALIGSDASEDDLTLAGKQGTDNFQEQGQQSEDKKDVPNFSQLKNFINKEQEVIKENNSAKAEGYKNLFDSEIAQKILKENKNLPVIAQLYNKYKSTQQI